jgi:hypothetical protein
MPRALTPTKLSLARWAQLVGIHPLHFAQVTLPETPPSVCGQPWIQHSWQQADRVGREDLAQAIAEAESDIETHLRARLLPTWEVDEWRPTIRPYKPEFVNLNSRDVRGYEQALEANWKHFISGGVQLKTLLEAASAVTYTDLDGDTYFETATTTTPVTFTDVCEIHVYYPGKAGADAWEIRPINVVIAAGVATITFRRELAVLEALYEDFEPEAVDGTDNANFLTTVDIYRKENDPQQQATFLWEPVTTCGCGVVEGCSQCSYATQAGCLRARGNPHNSMLSYQPGDWDADTETFTAVGWAIGRQPDIVRLWYYAGLRDERLACPRRQMPNEWERAVAYFAAAKLERPLCECNNIHAWIEKWRRDLAVKGEEGLSVSKDDLDCPFGTLEGAVYAWRRIKASRELVGQAVLA